MKLENKEFPFFADGKIADELKGTSSFFIILSAREIMRSLYFVFFLYVTKITKLQLREVKATG